MCGIAGIIGKGRRGRLIETMTHRGPDGVRVEDGDGCSLAHARLSIIDLEGGWQPLHAAGSTVIGNGEIYNYVELIEEFGLKDAAGDRLGLRAAAAPLRPEGPAAFERLRGMYAFCLIGRDGRTWLVRDPFGIKPLYYARHAEGLALRSEPRAFGRTGAEAGAGGRAAGAQLRAGEPVRGNHAASSPAQALR